MSQPPILDNLIAEVEAAGFCYAAHDLMRGLLEKDDPKALSDWDRFGASWNNMPQDRYMADGGRYRRRRYATLSAANEGEIKLEPHQPHYQSIAYNALNGGIAREFSPIAADVVLGSTMTSILRFCQKIFGQLIPAGQIPYWHIELHQFRIEAGNGKEGKPTPEGVHRDGVDFVLVMMVRRENVSSGVTTMHDLEQRRLDSFTLVSPLDCAIVNDKRCMHGVTAVEQVDPDKPAYRDVLVVTFRNALADHRKV